MRLRPLAALALVASLAAAPRPSLASGFLVARFGGEHGHVTTDNPTAIYYNPAGLALLGGTRLYLDGAFAWRGFTFTRSADAIDNILASPDVGAGTPAGDGVAANSGEATLFNVLASPFFGIASDLGVENLGVGLAFYVPIGGSTVFDDAAASETYPGAVDSPARWSVIEGTIRSMYLSAGVAYRIPSLRLSFGAALNLVYSEMDTLRARNADGSDHLVSGGHLQEGRALVDVSGFDLALGLGLIWEPVEHLFVGLSYQSQPGFGRQTLDDGTFTLILGSGPIDEVKPSPAEFTQSLPDIVRFGVRYEIPERWALRAFGEWAHWSVMTDQCVLDRSIDGRRCSLVDPVGKVVIIPRNWNDAFGVRVGGSWWVGNVELYGGAGWDGNAIPDRFLDPAFYDADKISLALGARFPLVDDTLYLSAAYTQIFYASRTPAARGRVPVDANDPDGPTLSDISDLGISAEVRQPDMAGRYEQSIGLFNLSLDARL